MKPSEQQLATINSRLPGYKLKKDDVEVLPFYVFDNKLTDRYTVMSPEMMAKLVLDLNSGAAAFNKLHQSQSDLPVGASVSGRIVDHADGRKELQAMMYAALKRPNGSPFEAGQDLIDRYMIGAVRACSAGVQVGFYKCNICGNDVRSWANCDHIPGRQYTVDEVPKTCVALMTGHKIVNGVAEDCGIYEVSAVTAGGVAAAGALTEAFGRYDGGMDPKEFKKTALTEKGIDMRVEFSAALNLEAQASKEDTDMSMSKEEVQAMLNGHYEPLKQANTKLTEDYAALQADQTKLAGEYEAAKAELVLTTGKLEASAAEFAVATKELETVKAENTGLAAFKAEYISLVQAKGIKAGETLVDEEFAAKTLEELIACNKAYDVKIADLPDGQKTGEHNQEAFASLDDGFYKA